MTSLIATTASRGSWANDSGAIITELPISFHWAWSRSSDSLSHAIWRLPVIVRSGSSASSWICGSGNGAAVVTISSR